jgi:hypothetical protein
MNSFPPQLPPVRIDFAAHKHLRLIVGKIKQSGRGITLQRYLSDLILSQPIPKDNCYPLASTAINQEAGSAPVEGGVSNA